MKLLPVPAGLEDIPGKDLQRCLALIGDMTQWMQYTNPPVEEVEIARIAAFQYASNRTAFFKCRMEDGVSVDPVALIHYVDLDLYCPDSEWHQIYAAKALGRLTVACKVTSALHSRQQLMFLDRSGLWRLISIDERKSVNGWAVQIEAISGLNESELKALSLLGVEDVRSYDPSTYSATMKKLERKLYA